MFIGPCASKKLEASREDVRSDVDFVITFEELVGMFEAKGIDPASYPGEDAGGQRFRSGAAGTRWPEACPAPLKPVSTSIIRR